MLTGLPHARCGSLLLALACGIFCGCESPSWIRSLNDSFHHQAAADRQAEEKYRRQYRETHDRKALHWLLARRVEVGMSYGDVCKILGEDGTREPRDTWLKSKGGSYQLGDEVYAFGPDSDGQTVYLAFREDMLINFSPSDFRSTAAID